MRNSRPMPSPNGSNHARQYLPATFPMRSPVAAYDAAEGSSPDAAKAIETREKLQDFLTGKISDDDLQSVLRMIGPDDMSMDGEDDDGGMPIRGTSGLDRPNYAQDGRYRRPTAMSRAAEAEFNRMFPDAKRIGHV